MCTHSIWVHAVSTQTQNPQSETVVVFQQRNVQLIEKWVAFISIIILMHLVSAIWCRSMKKLSPMKFKLCMFFHQTLICSDASLWQSEKNGVWLKIDETSYIGLWMSKLNGIGFRIGFMTKETNDSKRWMSMNMKHLIRCNCGLPFFIANRQKSKWFLKPSFNLCCRTSTMMLFIAAVIKYQGLTWIHVHCLRL